MLLRVGDAKIRCFYASVTRRLPDGSVFFPDQRMSRMEALRSYTINCAKGPPVCET